MAEKKAEKVETVIIKVNLDCCHCFRKIKNALCKLQKHFKIHSIVYEEKKNTVVVTGAFDPDCFIKKLCCLASKVIKEVSVKPPPPPPPCPPPPTPCPPPPPPCPPPPPPPKEVVVKFPVWPCPFPPWPACCHQPCPCYEPQHDCCRCCTCGQVSVVDQPPPQHCDKRPPCRPHSPPHCRPPPPTCRPQPLPDCWPEYPPHCRPPPPWCGGRPWEMECYKVVCEQDPPQCTIM